MKVRASTHLPNRSDATPEIQLWAEVVSLAITDACGGNTLTDDIERHQARAFFTAERGPWAKARQDVLTLLGLDPESVRKRIAAKIGRTGASA